MSSSKTVTIRHATVDDLPNMAEGAQAFYASSRFLVGFKLDRFCERWKGLIENGIGTIFVLSDGQQIRGALGAVAHQDLYSDQMHAVEMFWFVLPEFRGQGLRLLSAFEEWGKEKGCAVIRMVHLADSMPAKLASLYERTGYMLFETHYMKELG